MTHTTYSNRSNAIRAARKALSAQGVTDAMSGVHFRLKAEGDEWAWVQIDPQTGAVAAEEMLTEQDQVSHALTEILTPADERALNGLDAEGPAPDSNEPVEGFAPVESREARRHRLIREADERRARGEKAPKVSDSLKGREPKAPRDKTEDKLTKLLTLVQSPEGLTETQLKAITGWTKFGGFYGAVKKAGLTMTREKVEGVNVWRAAPAQPEQTA